MMKQIFLSLGAIILALTPYGSVSAQNTGRLYRQMSPSEQALFVQEQAAQIGRQISGREYEFTPAFEMEIQKHIDQYVRRIGNSAGDHSGKSDVRLVFRRGSAFAPTLMATFKARQVSPLIGLYLPLIESEYVNVSRANSMGAIGMFQFLPQTGIRYGLSSDDLLSVEKSADAAARYIANNITLFADNSMKEALALLSYNRGTQNTRRDLELVRDGQNKDCSICALTAARTKLDKTFQDESVHYVPQFFAAAIIGENPQVFDLGMAPLSSFEQKP
ncbi:MAG TPA: transglycosylase SLT domain-containing protein [Pyrinomonadaceae bacterium]|nr:transglycosylase SLT domain-containing protein [Pyrinomonadaceae bacterium]